MLASILSCEPDGGVVQLGVWEGVWYLGSEVFGRDLCVRERGVFGVRCFRECEIWGLMFERAKVVFGEGVRCFFGGEVLG